jgi:hypothetical protein
MRYQQSLTALCTLALLAAIVPRPAAADVPYGVARIAASSGPITVQHDDGTEDDGYVNSALVPGDAVATGGGTRAVVQMPNVGFRLSSNTETRIVSADGSNDEMQMAQGTVVIKDFSGNPDGTIDTPSVSVTSAGGDCRLSVDGNGVTHVAPRSGSCLVATPNGTVQVNPGQSLVASGDASNPDIQQYGAIPEDSFDQYSFQQDQYAQQAVSGDPYLSPQLAMYSNLNSYGGWYNVPGYGHVWHPHYANGWAPYHQGHWATNGNYGYVWVGDEPWGWAPYHYGRWFQDNRCGGWCWAPPASNQQNVNSWSPGLVAFVAVGAAVLSWVALAPHDDYHPWYNHQRGYTNLNFVSYNQVNHYHNYRVSNAFAQVPSASFRRGERVTPRAIGYAAVAHARYVAPRTVVYAPVRQTTVRNVVKFSPRIAAARQMTARPGVRTATAARPAFAAMHAGPRKATVGSIAALRTANLAHRPATAARPANRPAVRPVAGRPNQPVRPIAGRPVNHPAARPVTRPVTNAAARPAYHAPAAAARPAYHAPAAAARPAYHAPAAPARPVYHAPAAPAYHAPAPVARPVYHAPAAVARPVYHAPAPVQRAPQMTRPAPVQRAPQMTRPAPVQRAAPPARPARPAPAAPAPHDDKNPPH